MRILAALFASGCATIGTVQTAGTLGDGDVQVAMEPALWGHTGTAPFLVPHVNLAVRYGVGERFDVGARFGSSGFEITTKGQVTDPARDGPIVSFAPSFGGASVGGGESRLGVVFLQMPVLLGIPVGAGHELVLAPKVHDWYLFAGALGAEADANLLSVGGSVGFAARAGPRFRILPELAVVVPVYGNLGGAALGFEEQVGGPVAGSGVMVQATVGLLIGD